MPLLPHPKAQKDIAQLHILQKEFDNNSADPI